MSLCNDQETFNNAFRTAIKEYNKHESKKLSGVLTVYMIIHLFFIILGVMLAVKSVPKENRVIHITLAIIFGPAYCLAYYLNMLEK